MSEVNGLNIFGSLTTQNGVKLKFEDFDLNKDGTVSEQEFKSVLDANEIDTVDLSNVDGNADKVLSAEEFAEYEYKMQIQEILNGLQAQIALDFSGDLAGMAPDICGLLKSYTKDFIANSNLKGEELVAAYKEALPIKYNEIKTEYVEKRGKQTGASSETEGVDTSSPANSALQSQILDEVVSAFMDAVAAADTTLTPEQIEAVAKALGKRVEILTDNFIASYTGDNLEVDLRAYVNDALNISDSERMSGEVENYRAVFGSLGAYIDRGDTEKLKEAAIQLLTKALNDGQVLTLNGEVLSSETAIAKVVNAYTDAEQLNADIEEIIAGFSTESLQNAIIKEILGEEQGPTLTADDVKVNAEDLDLTFLEKYGDEDVKLKRNEGKSIDEAIGILNKNLKAQLEAQVKADFEAKGLDYNEFKDMFEKIYSESASIAAEGSVKENKWWIFKKKFTVDPQELVTKFLEVFNEKLGKAVEEMYASTTDMDTLDIDLDVALKIPAGLRYSDRKEMKQILEAYENGEVITQKNRGADYYVEFAQIMADNLKSTFLQKAQNMCKANGVEFDAKAFKISFEVAISFATYNNIEASQKYKWSNKLGTECSFDPAGYLNDLTAKFKEQYTLWVEKQKAGNTEETDEKLHGNTDKLG